MKVHISQLENKVKPDTPKIKQISATILDTVFDGSIQDIAQEISTTGKAIVLAHFLTPRLNKFSAIHGQELIMLDFDNSDPSNQYTLSDLKKDKFMQENACFYYKTFGYKKGISEKFRVAFVLTKPISDNYLIEMVYQDLFEKYPMSDTSVGQVNRIFFGSNKGYSEINFNNRLNADSIVDKILYAGIEEVPEGEIIDSQTPNYKLLKYGKKELVRDRYNGMYKAIFPDEFSAINYFCSLDLKSLLGLPDENPFLDILHEETNPSASVYYSEDYGTYFYKCFSKNNKFTNDIVGLLAIYLESDTQEIIDLLVYVTESKITNTTPLGKTKLNSNIFKKDLLDGKLHTKYPELYSILKRYDLEIALTIDYMFDYVYQDETGKLQYLNNYSIASISRMLTNALKKNISIDKTKNILNLIVVTELIQKLPENKIPKELYETIVLEQKGDLSKLRISNFYAPENTSDVHKGKMEEIAKTLRENSVNVSSLSYELVYRLFGEEKANKDFEQAYKPLVEKKLIKMSSKDKNLTNKSLNLEKSLIKIIHKELEECDYVYESIIISKLAKLKKMKIATMKPKYYKIRADVFNKYGLSRSKLTKNLYNELNIQEPYSPKVVIYRIK